MPDADDPALPVALYHLLDWLRHTAPLEPFVGALAAVRGVVELTYVAPVVTDSGKSREPGEGEPGPDPLPEEEVERGYLLGALLQAVCRLTVPQRVALIFGAKHREFFEQILESRAISFQKMAELLGMDFDTFCRFLNTDPADGKIDEYLAIHLNTNANNVRQLRSAALLKLQKDADLRLWG